MSREGICDETKLVFAGLDASHNQHSIRLIKAVVPSMSFIARD